MSEIIKSVDPDRLLGLNANLYYNNELNRFQLGSVLFEVTEDPDDGYRSYFRELMVVDTNAPKREGDLLGEVTMIKVESGDCDGYEVVGTDGHVWVEFGTNRSDDYYPCFYFNFNPRKS